MPKMTAGYAKNTMRRALRAIVDPEPSEREISSLWDYYKSSCAYCGRGLKKEGREGHIDHLISITAKNGTNDISNRVLSCSICNGDEKGELPWDQFLQLKVKDPPLLESRKKRIEDWISKMSPQNKNVIDHVMLDKITNGAIEAFDNATELLRQSRK